MRSDRIADGHNPFRKKGPVEQTGEAIDDTLDNGERRMLRAAVSILCAELFGPDRQFS